MTDEQLTADYSNPAFLSNVMLASAITDEDVETYIKFSYTNGGTVWREVLAEVARRLTHKLRCASGIAEVVRRDDVERRIWSHYDHAREKHPYFCDFIVQPCDPHYFTEALAAFREMLSNLINAGELDAISLASCELHEVAHACVNRTPQEAVEECFDCIAVLLRVIDVLEGRQKLGRPDNLPMVVERERNYRPATEDEVANGKAAWCHACQSTCINRGKDALVTCDGFTPCE